MNTKILNMVCPYCEVSISNESDKNKIYCSECGRVIYIGLFKDININRLLSASEMQFWEYKQLHALYGADRKKNLDELIFAVANEDYSKNVFPFIKERHLLWELRYGQQDKLKTESKSFFSFFKNKTIAPQAVCSLDGVSENIFVDKGLAILQNLILYSKQPSWNNKRLARKELTKFLAALNNGFDNLNQSSELETETIAKNTAKSDKTKVIPSSLSGQAIFVLRQEIISLVLLYISLCLKSKHYTALIFGFGKRKASSSMNKIWDDLLLFKEIYLEPNSDQEVLKLCGEAIVEALNLHNSEHPEMYKD